VFERFKNRSTDDNGATASTVDGDRSTATRTAPEDERPVADDRAAPAGERTAAPAGERTAVAPARRTAGRPRGAVTRETMADIHARQREEFGGINWGAAFFGWLVAVGVAVLLTGILAAAGAAIGLTETTSNATDNTSPETLSLVGAIALLVVLAIAYYCGGYVAGRMSRFDGARQGIAAWAIGLLITLALAVLAVVAGSQYNVVERANLPRLPIGSETLTTGGAIASVAILLGTLLFAALGGIAGARYHRRIDRAGYVD
jgi:amino acid transporter